MPISRLEWLRTPTRRSTPRASSSPARSSPPTAWPGGPPFPLGMASYAYTAINPAGLELDGQVNAPDANAAREALRVRGLVALTLDEQGSSSAGFAMAGERG